MYLQNYACLFTVKNTSYLLKPHINLPNIHGNYTKRARHCMHDTILHGAQVPDDQLPKLKNCKATGLNYPNTVETLRIVWRKKNTCDMSMGGGGGIRRVRTADVWIAWILSLLHNQLQQLELHAKHFYGIAKQPQ